MSNYNHVTLVGTLTKNPILSYTAKKVTCNFVIACERSGHNPEHETDYFNIVTYGKLAEITSEYLKAGRKCLIDGKIQIRKEKDLWITEVIGENLKFLSNPVAKETMSA